MVGKVPSPLTRTYLRKVISAYKKAKGDMDDAAKLLDITPSQWLRVWKFARRELPDEIPHELRRKGGQPGLTDEAMIEAWEYYERYGYVHTDAAAALGLPTDTFRNRVYRAVNKFGYKKKELGYNDERKPTVLPLPPEGEIAHYFIACAQNNTQPHKPLWQALTALSSHHGGTIKLSTITYLHKGSGSAKKGTFKDDSGMEEWYAPELEPYLCDEYEQLAPGLVLCGHTNILPTAVRPLSGFESYTGRASGIFPHPKVAMEPIGSHKGEPAKHNYTTGAVTLRNYIQKKAGQKAEFHHTYGALHVEVNSSGDWWVRQIGVDKTGTLYDLDLVVTPHGEVKKHDGVEAIVWGDVHVRKIDPGVKQLAWGKGGMLDLLKPKHQVMHDVLDFESRNHHSRKNPHERFRVWHEGKDSVMEEVKEAAEFLNWSARDWCMTEVVNSNHDNALTKWMRETNAWDDIPNAEFYLEANLAMIRAIKAKDVSFLPFEWAAHNLVAANDNVKFLKQDESFVVCKDSHGGIELGMHGDLGINGARGSGKGLARMGRKACIGHAHSSGIYDGVYVAGLSGTLDQGYNVGPGSWSHSHVVVYPNGKRAIVTMWRGRYSPSLPTPWELAA